MSPSPTPSRPAASRLARLRRAAWGDGAAIVALLLALGVASAQVVRGWVAERRTARRVLLAELDRAARAYGDIVLRSATARMPALLGQDEYRPVGTDAAALAALDARAARWMALLRVGDDPQRGVLRATVRGDTLVAVRGRGALADPDTARRAAAAALAVLRDRPRNVSGSVLLRLTLRGVPSDLLAVLERDAAERVVALRGVSYTRARLLAPFAEDSRAAIPLLPPTFLGVDWVTAQPVAATRDAAIPFGSPRNAERQALLALRLEEESGTILHATPRATDAVWRSAYVGTARLGAPPRTLVVRAALPAAHAERLVRAAVPLGARQLTLGSLLALAALFAAGAVRAARRRRELAQARAELVSVVSHELRTPIAHIAALADTLLLGGGTPAQERRFLTAIGREATRLGRLTENVLLHARGRRGPLPIHRQRTDLREIVRDTVALIVPLATAQDVRVAIDVPDVPVVADVDGGALRQVLLNLLENALKYGPRGQTVRVALAPLAGEPPVVTLCVDDEGPGIPAAARERAWLPFVRLGDATSVTSGSGLGLSVVRALVRAHGGDATIDDAPGGGARLRVTLPTHAPRGAR